jgi:hypothetical protein
MTGSEVAEREQGGELAQLSPEEASLVAEAQSAIDVTKLKVPGVKLANELTQEVKDGLVEEGEWVNSVTGESYGEEFDFIVAALYNGRFYSDKDGRAFVATGDTAPSNWPEEYAGKKFADIPDAEEQWKAAVNAEKKEWGSGPPISNTHNFIGYINGETAMPVRLSLQRSSVPAADKMKTVIALARAPWDKVFTLKAVQASSGRYTYFKADSRVAGVPEPELRQKAVDLAVAYRDNNVELTGDAEAESKPKPKGSGGKSGGLGLGDDD